MYEEEKWYKMLLKWIEKQLENLLEHYGFKKCIIGTMIIGTTVMHLLILFNLLWNMETDISVNPIISMQEVLQEDKEVLVTRTNEMSEGISISSLSVDVISSISSEAEAITLFNDLAEACHSVSQKDKVIVLPKGAGEILFEKIGVYTWTRSGKHFLSDKEFSEIHVVLFMEEQYIEAYIYCSERIKLDVGVLMGTCQ